jgi:cell wall-associated NlpC family hydrolase
MRYVLLTCILLMQMIQMRAMNDMKKLEHLYKQLEVSPQMQQSSYWAAQWPDADGVIMTSEQIQQFNRYNIDTSITMTNIFDIAPTISSLELQELISQTAAAPTSQRYFATGNPIEAADIQRYTQLMQVPTDQAIPLHYGITVQRSYMRTFPTDEGAFRKNGDFDYFMETAVYLCEPLLIYHTSVDGRWYYAAMYNYRGWIPAHHVALTTRDALQEYLTLPEYRVVITPRYYLQRGTTLLQADMGVRIPCQNAANTTVELLLPVRDARGKLAITPTQVPDSDKLSPHYLAYSRANLLSQAFRFQGEIYGWGGMHGTRDCSGLIMDIYRSMGLQLPRNASHQAESAAGVYYPMGEHLDAAERTRLLAALPGPMPVYLRGHTMLYLGMHNGAPWILHDFSAFRAAPDGPLIDARITAVTPLNIFRSSGITYLKELYGARDFRF